MTCRALWCREW